MPRRKAKGYGKKYSEAVLKAFWNKERSRIDHISTNVHNAEKVISSSEIDYDNDFGVQIHCISEYPHLLNGKKIGEEKKLAYAVDRDCSRVIPKTAVMSKGISFPKEDTYLPYRALDISDMKLPVTKMAIRKRGLADMNITVKTDCKPNEDENNFLAMFSNWHGDISYNKLKPFFSKASLVFTAFHEAEHAWHYYLDARLSEGGTPWADIIYFLFGPLKSKRQIKEAEEYKQSIDNYVPYNGKNREEYMKNYIEIKADEAGEKAETEYKNQGEIMRKNFPHIPAELL